MLVYRIILKKMVREGYDEMEEYKVYEREVCYYETDRMGIVHHSNYIRWFEEARIDFLKQMGYTFKKIEDEGIMIPVLSVESTYRKPMRFGDTFVVKIIPGVFNGIKFNMKYEIRKKGEDEVFTTGESSHCFVNNEMKPILIRKTNPEIYNVFEKYFMSKKKM